MNTVLLLFKNSSQTTCEQLQSNICELQYKNFNESDTAYVLITIVCKFQYKCSTSDNSSENIF